MDVPFRELEEFHQVLQSHLFIGTMFDPIDFLDIFEKEQAQSTMLSSRDEQILFICTRGVVRNIIQRVQAFTFKGMLSIKSY